MRTVDFHTHIFPDRIAERTLALLSKKGGISPYTDGTYNGLLAALREANVSLAVNLPVLTRPEQYDSVNRFAEFLNEAAKSKETRLLSFGGIHPACEDIPKKMADLKRRGFLGVKVHPDYQETFFDDEGYVEIVKAAAEQDMIVITHAGVDIAYRGQPVRCTPRRVLNLLDRVPNAKLVLAHYGASEMFSEVYELLCGKNVYFDTAFIMPYIAKDTFLRILDRHGTDKILFGSDSPWGDIPTHIQIINSFVNDEATRRKILCENAEALLGI